MPVSSSPCHLAFDLLKLKRFICIFVTWMSFAFRYDGVGGEENPMEP